MPAELLASFKVWEEDHKKLGTWLSEGPGDKHDRDHFHDIRSVRNSNFLPNFYKPLSRPL
jgi:hypothetical protein